MRKKIFIGILLLLLLVFPSFGTSSETILVYLEESWPDGNKETMNRELSTAFEDGVLESFYNNEQIVTDSGIKFVFSDSFDAQSLEKAYMMGMSGGSSAILLVHIRYRSLNKNEKIVPVSADFKLLRIPGKLLLSQGTLNAPEDAELLKNDLHGYCKKMGIAMAEKVIDSVNK